MPSSSPPHYSDYSQFTSLASSPVENGKTEHLRCQNCQRVKPQSGLQNASDPLVKHLKSLAKFIHNDLKQNKQANYKKTNLIVEKKLKRIRKSKSRSLAYYDSTEYHLYESQI